MYHFSCQFVVSEGNNYSAHVADPDTLVDWDFIEQVVSSLIYSQQKQKDS